MEGNVAQEGGVTDRRGRYARGLFNRRWDLVTVFKTAKGRTGISRARASSRSPRKNKGIMDAFLDLSLDDLQTRFQMVDYNNDPKTQKHILGSQFTVIGTRRRRKPAAHRRPAGDEHPASWALRIQQALTLEDAVWRLTGKTALMHDMHDRGFVQAGKIADITIFDPDTIAPKAREPVASLPGGGIEVKREAEGIDHVIVNGTVLLDNGVLTDALPGQIIRGPLYQPRA